jgi:hypothetical protein
VHKHRESRGLTATGKKSRGLGKGHRFNKTTAGRRKTWKRHVSLIVPYFHSLLIYYIEHPFSLELSLIPSSAKCCGAFGLCGNLENGYWLEAFDSLNCNKITKYVRLRFGAPYLLVF